MNNKEVIEQLETLKLHCEGNKKHKHHEPWESDIEALNFAIKTVEQTEVKGDLISREALKKDIMAYKTMPEIRKAICEVIDNAPTVDTYTDEDIKQAIKENFEIGYEMAKNKFERKTGEWIKGKDSCSHFFFCSECKCGIQSDWDIIVNFCPECGADMRVKDELNRVKDELKEGEE